MKKVITYGTYDLLHYGHIRLLERAKALGDYLIVGVTADDFDKLRGKINIQQSLMERVEADGARKTLLYCLGDKGVNVIAKGSFHAETINLLSENLAVMEEVAVTGSGNEVDLEQILQWDPDVIIFAPDSCYEEIGTSAQWQSVGAVARGNYYKTPAGPYGWLSSPPAVQRYLGMLWLGTLLYPEYAEYDLQEEITEYYRLFYGCELTQEMIQDLFTDAGVQ